MGRANPKSWWTFLPKLWRGTGCLASYEFVMHSLSEQSQSEKICTTQWFIGRWRSGWMHRGNVVMISGRGAHENNTTWKWMPILVTILLCALKFQWVHVSEMSGYTYMFYLCHVILYLCNIKKKIVNLKLI